ncbi:MAG: hypothetical protein MRERC_3c015 [Mycoplasmataceae bacterium RC_NB112A]|nr:MAG: hypothetical protein MRERC_9c073 [Mycoplasmataceae bacterium RC_NB112A]KLL02192.1 MAG: hypothetical protein MRERC_3c015 [Mycoplasmataceae bacterium RC_NB112A]
MFNEKRELSKILWIRAFTEKRMKKTNNQEKTKKERNTKIIVMFFCKIKIHLPTFKFPQNHVTNNKQKFFLKNLACTYLITSSFYSPFTFYRSFM